MRIKFGPLTAIFLSLVLPACGLFQGGDGRVVTGSGRVTSETRAVSGIVAVALEGLGEVVIEEGAAEALTIEAEDNLLPLIASSVEDGTLRLGFNRATWRDTIRPTEPIRFVISVRELQSFDLKGSGSMQSSSLHTDQLLLRISGDGDATIEHLESQQLEVHINGTGHVDVAGTVGDQVVEITGSGQVLAGDLDSQTARVTIGGTGDVVVWTHTDLAVNITGSGTVSYWGDPHVSRRDISGTGDVNPMGVK